MLNQHGGHLVEASWRVSKRVLEENKIVLACVASNCTDLLQPIDLSGKLRSLVSVNKSLNYQRCFVEWYIIHSKCPFQLEGETLVDRING